MIPPVRRDLPTYRELIYPTLRAVASLGGSAQGAEITDALIELLKATPEQLAVTYDGRPKSVLIDRMDWARSYAKLGGVLDSPRRGLFILSNLGKHVLSLPEEEGRAQVAQLDRDIRAARRRRGSDEGERQTRSRRRRGREPMSRPGRTVPGERPCSHGCTVSARPGSRSSPCTCYARSGLSSPGWVAWATRGSTGSAWRRSAPSCRRGWQCKRSATTLPRRSAGRLSPCSSATRRRPVRSAPYWSPSLDSLPPPARPLRSRHRPSTSSTATSSATSCATSRSASGSSPKSTRAGLIALTRSRYPPALDHPEPEELSPPYRSVYDSGFLRVTSVMATRQRPGSHRFLPASATEPSGNDHVPGSMKMESMQPPDFWTEYEVYSPWTSVPEGKRGLNTELLESLRSEPLADTSDVTAAERLLELTWSELEAFGTGGGNECDDKEIAVAIRTLEAVTRRLGIPLELPFRDFTRFKTYWLRNDGYGSWQARRDILEDLLGPTRKRAGDPRSPPDRAQNQRGTDQRSP